VIRRSPYDREIVKLALPALGALAAEPLYLLVDTAIVGHLGTRELAALAIAATVLSSAFWICNFLAYGTTAQVARASGAGEDERAGELAAQALWLAVALGAALTLALAVLAGPIVTVMGAEGRTHDLAETYLRISALGVPMALIALAGQGWLRGVGNLTTALWIVLAGNALNVVLEVLFVYGFGWGLDGSAWGTVIAQAVMGALFVGVLLRAPARDRRPHWALIRPMLRMGGDIAVRTGALLLSFAVASAVLARMGESSLGAHQVAFQLFVFLALVLDAIAIAGQVLTGRRLGAGDIEGTRAAARRMCELCLGFGLLLAVVLLALNDVLPRAFTSDAGVLAKAHDVWWIFALIQVPGALVFALDGILIGAGDTRFLMWGMLAAAFLFYVPIALCSLWLGWGIEGVWWGFAALMVVRLVTNGARFLRGRWLVTGAAAPV
jgi:putative MATE family efflux protein